MSVSLSETLLIESPTLAPKQPVPPGLAVSVSHVSQRRQRLACWLKSTAILRLCLSPHRYTMRLSQAQDSKTAPVLPLILITTCLLPLRGNTRITFRNTPRRCTFRVELYIERQNLRSAVPVAPLSLATLHHF